MKAKQQILIFGGASAAYRPTLYTQYFLERPEQFAVVVSTGDLFAHFWKPLRVVLRILHMVLSVSGCDILLIQPMQHTSPYSQLLIRLAKLLGKKVIVEFYISSYETNVIDRKLLESESKGALKLLKRDLSALDFADVTIFLNKAEALYYHTVWGRVLKPEKIFTLPLVVPMREQARLPYIQGIKPYPVVAWWGREGNPLHGLDSILSAIRILLQRGSNVHFALFGTGGPAWHQFKSAFPDVFEHAQVFASAEYSFTNGKLTLFCVESVDLAFGTFGATQKAKTVIVNKVLDAASFGIPSITQHSAGLSEYFTDGFDVHFCGIEPEAIANSLSEILQAKDDLIKIGEGARDTLSKHFAVAAFQRRLDDLTR